MPKLKINSDFTNDTYIIGISSPEKVYKLCWQMNNAPQFHFKFSHLHLHNPITNQGFATYHSIYDEQDVFLLCNRDSNQFLLKKYQLFNYFIICETMNYDDFKSLQTRLQSIKNITATKVLEIKNQKEASLLYIEK